jgi:PhoPQ-activated pathogenicity-related protein
MSVVTSLVSRFLVAVALIAPFPASICSAADLPEVASSALDRYIAKEDASYRWKVVQSTPGDGVTSHVIDMTSQTWRTTADVDRTEWQHWVTIVVPDKVTSDSAFLLIGGGRNGGEPPKEGDAFMKAVAAATGSVTVEIKMTPNQPLVFHNDGVKRVEDDLIGYCWDQYLKTGDETWATRLPMVKGVVRAMDTAQAFCASEAGGTHEVKRFVVAGGSKRGWTTWLTGAADPRVAAIVPIVIDVVNVKPSMDHHHAAYGFWAPAVGDYVHHKIVDRRGTPEYANLLAIEDPFSYRARLTMPKYIVNASGDQFFLPDSSQFYFDELPGEKHLRYVPNADHSLDGSDARESIAAFYNAVSKGIPRPEFTWTFDEDGAIRVKTEVKPTAVKVWKATNPAARDFRKETIGAAFTSGDVTAEAGGVYVARVPIPRAGWTAYFVELEYDSQFVHPFKFTTSVRVMPDTLPHAGELDALEGTK